MKVYKHFPFTGRVQTWAVPKNVTEAVFECWGAGGGMPSYLEFHGKAGQTMGGSGPTNSRFYNSPASETQLGASFANGAGYVSGKRTVTEGEVYRVYVGGNGGPGYSTIRLTTSGSYVIGLRGGAGGWNGGGTGGQGAHVFQNLYNRNNTTVAYRQASTPLHPKAGQQWYDTDAHLTKQWTGSQWVTLTHYHGHAVGPSGGGGGGATDVRLNGDDLSNRILVAGGGGGAGGRWNRTGTGAWTLREVPATPAPPFGTDTTATGATGVDRTWAASINYFTGGWGRGGSGGSDGPAPTGSPTPDGGVATAGGSGGPATGRHMDGGIVPSVPTAAGGGGGTLAGGHWGAGRGHSGTLGNGGDGGDADGGYDDWCAGGGGGGGGYYGGGGGGQGFKVAGDDLVDAVGTKAAGGGGGSNYVSSLLSDPILAGCARPPLADGSAGTGANGLGGFCRITYTMLPELVWSAVSQAVEAGTEFDASFVFTPAQVGGAPIEHYVVGTGAASDTFPTTTTQTVMVTDPTQTHFTQTFTAPGSGATEAIFVKAVDADGDSSLWLKQLVTGLAAGTTTPATITSPAADSQFVDSETVNWTLGTQTPLVAYRLGLVGSDLATGAVRTMVSALRRGGSRVNLATDPGFKGSAVWSGDSGSLASTTNFPGVSGSNGTITWEANDDGSAQLSTVPWNNLLPGVAYRLHIEIASAYANDSRVYTFQISDDDGIIKSVDVSLDAQAAGAYLPLDIEFTPHTQGVVLSLVPSGTGFDDSVDPLLGLDFEDGTVGPFSAANGGTVTISTTEANSGQNSLEVQTTNTAAAGAVADLSGDLGVAGNYVAEVWCYSATGQRDAQAYLQGITATSTVKDEWVRFRLPFMWDGASTVNLNLYGGTATSTGHLFYDDIKVWPADDTQDATGYPDDGQITYLANMLLEPAYEDGQYAAYFDGSHANGLTGAVAWQGATNASASVLTGADVTSDTLTYDGPPLSDAQIVLDTFSETALITGFGGAEVTRPVLVNPSLPATPTVDMDVNSTAGLITLTIDADDAAATAKTVYFDIFRNGTRIVTGLVPDQTSRLAVYTDTPATEVAVTYLVRAFDTAGGYADQSDGTVTVSG